MAECADLRNVFGTLSELVITCASVDDLWRTQDIDSKHEVLRSKTPLFLTCVMCTHGDTSNHPAAISLAGSISGTLSDSV